MLEAYAISDDDGIDDLLDELENSQEKNATHQGKKQAVNFLSNKT